MIEAIGSTISKISSTTIATVVGAAIILLPLIHLRSEIFHHLNFLFKKITLLRLTTVQVKQNLSAGKTESLREQLVGKFLTADFVAGKEVLGLKGTLISEQIALEAERRALLEKLEKISAFWPVEG